MALKLTVTPSTQYIEDSINIKATGYSSGEKIFITVSGSEYIGYDLINIPSNNFNYTFPSSLLNTIYNATSDRESVVVGFAFQSTLTGAVTKTMYIKPEPPTFDGMPTYEVVTNSVLNFTNDNQMIVRGKSRIAASNIDATAYKAATLDKIIVNDSASISYARAQELIQQQGYFSFSIHDTEQMDKPYLFFDIVDSRGFKTRTVLADISKFKYSYQKPIIKELTIERNGISEQTTLKAKGYYSEGYQEGINSLSTQYVYKENVEGSSTNVGQTTLTITKTPTKEYEDFVAILDEYNTPTYQLDENNLQYYEKQTFESGIDDLFSNAILYNDKYTQEYLQNDYDSANERYYCKSGGYNGSWHNFWKETLEAIYAKMYGDNTIYLDKFGDENGGNYEFEIEAIIQGDTQAGFSIDKVFNITLGIIDSQTSGYTEGYNRKTVLLPTAIPAIDVYKSNVAIHGLYDETLDGTQLNGDLYVDGVKVSLNKSSITCNCKTNTNNTSTSSFTQIPLTEIINNGTKLMFDATNNRIYAEEDCTVIASAQLYITAGVTSASTSVSVCIRKNGSQYKRALCPTPNNYRMTQVNGALINLVQGDYIDLAFLSGDKTGITCSSGADSYITITEV